MGLAEFVSHFGVGIRICIASTGVRERGGGGWRGPRATPASAVREMRFFALGGKQVGLVGISEISEFPEISPPFPAQKSCFLDFAHNPTPLCEHTTTPTAARNTNVAPSRTACTMGDPTVPLQCMIKYVIHYTCHILQFFG